MAEKGPQKSKQFAKNFSAFHQHGLHESANYFTCSFSCDGDDLGQWRAYSDNGRGYAIGFDATALEDAFIYKDGIPSQNNSSFHITYDDDLLIELHRKMIDGMFDLISLPRGKGFDSQAINNYMNELSISLSAHALRASLFFKHKAYAHEKEYRFLQIHAQGSVFEINQRYRSYELVRFRKFDWRKIRVGVIKEIIVGPAANCIKPTQFAYDCMKAFGEMDAMVKCSDIPYRAL